MNNWSKIVVIICLLCGISISFWIEEISELHGDPHGNPFTFILFILILCIPWLIVVLITYYDISHRPFTTIKKIIWGILIFSPLYLVYLFIYGFRAREKETDPNKLVVPNGGQPMVDSGTTP